MSKTAPTSSTKPAATKVKAAAQTKPTQRKSILLRIDPELWADLDRWSREELRSLNAQIELVLRKAVRKHKGDKS